MVTLSGKIYHRVKNYQDTCIYVLFKYVNVNSYNVYQDYTLNQLAHLTLK